VNEIIIKYLKIIEEKEKKYLLPNVKENFINKLKNLGIISKPLFFK